MIVAAGLAEPGSAVEVAPRTGQLAQAWVRAEKMAVVRSKRVRATVPVEVAPRRPLRGTAGTLAGPGWHRPVM